MFEQPDPLVTLEDLIGRMTRFRRVVTARKLAWWVLAIGTLAAHWVWAVRSGQVANLQRGGAALTMFAFFMLFFTRGLPPLAESVIEAARQAASTPADRNAKGQFDRIGAIRRTQALADIQNLHIALIGTLGTLVWGYGDLLACLPLGLRGCPG